MKYKCMIVDDEELARGLLSDHLAKLDHFELVASCASAIEASRVLKNEKVDLLFLDIEMPVLKGTEFFKNLIDKPKVIFTTAYRDFALDGFELNAVDYLLKPITFARFFKAIEKFLAHRQGITTGAAHTAQPENAYVFVRKDRKQVKVYFAEILYVEGVKDYIKIMTENGSHLVKQSLTSFLEGLNHRFLRIHRSYIVNLDKITAYTNQDIEIGKFEVPIGDRYKASVLKHLAG